MQSNFYQLCQTNTASQLNIGWTSGKSMLCCWHQMPLVPKLHQQLGRATNKGSPTQTAISTVTSTYKISPKSSSKIPQVDESILMSLQLRPVSGWNSSRQHLPRAESAFRMARAARSWRMAVGSRDQKALGEQSWEPHNNDVATVFAPKKSQKVAFFCTAVWHARRGIYW